MSGSMMLAFAAGTLSILSPCVLPIIPIVLAAAAARSRWGPVALACGLAVSFVALGLFVATIGFAIGLNADVFRAIATVIMLALGIILLVPRLQAQVALASGPLANWADRGAGPQPAGGLSSQFLAGILLGAVWSPCVGPTLGAASLLAAQGRDLPQVALTMLSFGLGAALPLAGLGALSREAMMRWRSRMLSAGTGLKIGLGVLLVAFAGAVLTGVDKRVEAALVEASPQWLTDLTTRL